MSQDGVSHPPRCRDGTAARDPAPGEVSFSFPPTSFPVQWLKFASSPSLCGSVLLLTAGAATSWQLEPRGLGAWTCGTPKMRAAPRTPAEPTEHVSSVMGNGSHVAARLVPRAHRDTQGHTGPPFCGELRLGTGNWGQSSCHGAAPWEHQHGLLCPFILLRTDPNCSQSKDGTWEQRVPVSSRPCGHQGTVQSISPLGERPSLGELSLPWGIVPPLGERPSPGHHPGPARPLGYGSVAVVASAVPGAAVTCAGLWRGLVPLVAPGAWHGYQW